MLYALTYPVSSPKNKILEFFSNVIHLTGKFSLVLLSFRDLFSITKSLINFLWFNNQRLLFNYYYLFIYIFLFIFF